MSDPETSIILYDAGYRENFHLLECMKEQTYRDFEILWVDYWGEIKEELLMYEKEIEELSILCTMDRDDIEYDGDEYHHPQSINYGVAKAEGDIVMVMDADLLIKPDYLKKVIQMHIDNTGLLTTGRDRAEPHPHAYDEATWENVYPHTRLLSITNFGTCFTTRREHIVECNGWDEDEIWRGGGGMFNADMGWRLVTYGLEHRWYMNPIALHPWHPGSHRYLFTMRNFRAFLHRLSPGVFPPAKEQSRRKILYHRLENGIYRVDNGISSCLLD